MRLRKKQLTYPNISKITTFVPEALLREKSQGVEMIENLDLWESMLKIERNGW